MPKHRKKRSWTRHFKRRHGRKDNRVSLLTVIPAVNQALVQPGLAAYERVKVGDAQGAMVAFANNLANNWAFCDISEGRPIFNSNTITRSLGTYAMLLLGWGGSKLATAVGANKALRKIPLIGNRIKL